MTPEQFTEKLKDLYETNLLSVILYGSAAGTDYHKGYSDFNLLVILKDNSLSALAKSTSLCRCWMRDGNPAPLFVSEDHLESSRDVFPIEFLDMKNQHALLYGNDPFLNMTIDTKHLRLQCESELKGKLIALRSAWLIATPSKRQIKKLILKSSSSFFALFRGILRLLGESVPPKKRELLKKLNAKTRFDTAVFETILDIQEGQRKLSRSEVAPLMEEYLTTVERMASFVDKL